MRDRSVAEQWQHEMVHTITEMNSVNDRILSLMSAAGFCERDCFCVRLSLEEAIVNGIKHGHGGDSSKAIRISYLIDTHQVLAEVEDQGTGFDPQQIADPLEPENLERPYGRGLFLMRYYMTWVKFNDRGNCVTMCKARST
jgi:serine/threonine-protein kinase RsbW